MAEPASNLRLDTEPQGWLEGAVALLLGTAFTGALIFTLARIAASAPPQPAVEIEEIRRVTLPLDPPPPAPPLPQPVEPATDLPFSGLEIGASDSPVRIAVIPPDLETVVPTAAYVPARVELGTLHTELRPRIDIDANVRRVYQESEVDQKPRALIRTAPTIPAAVQGGAASLRVSLVLLIDEKGKVNHARVLESSGRPAFDEIVARCIVNEWRFTPAVRRGKNVKVLAAQGFRVNFGGGGGTPFSLD
jgi:TonB family C-terminal domain